MKVAARFDIHFRNMTLMLFNGKDEMHFKDFVDYEVSTAIPTSA